LLAKTRGDFFITVVDNGSGDGTPDWLKTLEKRDKRVSVHLLGHNYGVAVAANYGWQAGNENGADYYCKLDNDIEILHESWLDNLINALSGDDTVAQAGYQFLSRHEITPVILQNGAAFRLSECCGGACVLIPRRVHDLLGFWNEDYGRYGYEDFDYSLRAAWSGLKTGYLDRDDMARHLGYDVEVARQYEQMKKSSVRNATSGEKLFIINKLLFQEKIRPLRVQRKFVPQKGARGIRFAIAPSYMAIIRMQQKILAQSNYEILDERTVALDLRKLTQNQALIFCAE
jgi:glycosyltransferase involved in cell wall biosynthesis